MKQLKFILLSIAFLSISFLSGAQSKVQWSTKVEHITADNYQVVFTAKIEQGFHMYDLGPYGKFGPNETTFEFTPSSGLTLDGEVIALQESQRQFDEMFQMEIGWYEKTAQFAQKVKLSTQKASLSATAEWMVCDDTSCLPPEDKTFVVEVVSATPVVAQDGDTDKGITDADTSEQGASLQEGAVSREDLATAGDSGEILAPSAGVGMGASMWGLIIEAILWGFVALLTPCVFPMVPMTVSFFMQGSKSPAHGKFRASMYGFFIVALYTLPIAILIFITRFVGGETVTSDIFNWVATHWIPNVLFFIIFMVFAASFFGAFDINLPSWMVNKSDSKADRGGLGGVFFMALTLVLVSFSCTGPIVSTVVIQSTTGGAFWAPILTIFAFSLAFALPFTLLAFFPALLNKIPKSGGWLNSVKVTLGFVEVALGFKFLSVADQTYHWGILDREIYLAIWIVVFSLLGAYFLGKIKFKNDSEVKHLGVGRLALAIMTLSFVVYLIPGMWGAPLKGLSGYLPPMHTHDFVVGQYATAGGVPSVGIELPDDKNPGEYRKPKHSEYLTLPHNLSGFFDLDEAEEYARKVNKPVFVDITGHGCVNCREMEARVWSDPSILSLLRDEYVIVALYVDDKMILPESEWLTTDTGRVLKGLGKINAHVSLSRFGQNAQPYYVILGGEGEMLVPPRGYDLSIPGFEQFLRDGISAYKKAND